MIKRIVWLGVLLALVGCSSSPNTAGTTGTGGSGGGACTTRSGADASSGESLSWKDNGTPACAANASVVRRTTALVDTTQIYGATSANLSVDIVLSSYAGPLGGTYTCRSGDGGTAPNVTFDYVGSHGGGTATMSQCSVTIAFTQDTAGVQHATGTFSGTVASDAIDGGTYVITDGAFDLPVTLTGG
ncbi:MAG TPA: hypothetical protein VKZ18_02670, partial [Polyangia bacterium]|nr:hypothetical protein [Polyangia bacterium]